MTESLELAIALNAFLLFLNIFLFPFDFKLSKFETLSAKKFSLDVVFE